MGSVFRVEAGGSNLLSGGERAQLGVARGRGGAPSDTANRLKVQVPIEFRLQN